jgi:hypothetical protein
MRVCGKFVLSKTIAPISFKIRTIAASSIAGENERPTYPKVVSTPLRLN